MQKENILVQKKKAVKDRTPFNKCICVFIVPNNTKTLLKAMLNHWWGQSINQLRLYHCCSFRSTTSKIIITIIIIICISHLSSTLNTQWMSGMIGCHAMIHWFELWPRHCLPLPCSLTTCYPIVLFIRDTPLLIENQWKALPRWQHLVSLYIHLPASPLTVL